MDEIDREKIRETLASITPDDLEDHTQMIHEFEQLYIYWGERVEVQSLFSTLLTHLFIAIIDSAPSRKDTEEMLSMSMRSAVMIIKMREEYQDDE